MGKKGEDGPSWEEQTEQARNYWNSYNTWTLEEDARLEKDLATERARIAQSGQNPGESSRYTAYEKSRMEAYNTSMKELESGEHARFLKEYQDQEFNQRTGAWRREGDSKFQQDDYGDGGGSRYINWDLGREANRLEKDISMLKNPNYMGGDDSYSESQLIQRNDAGDYDWDATEKTLSDMRTHLSKAPKKGELDEFYTSLFGKAAGPNTTEEDAAKERAKGYATGRTRREAAAVNGTGTPGMDDEGRSAWWG